MKVIKRPNLKKYVNRVDASIKALLPNELITGIVNRTQSGKDSIGRSFSKYTPKYAKAKGSTTVNLTDSSKMLNSITHKIVNSSTLRLYFGSQNENKKAHGNQVKNGRKFFMLDKKQTDYIKKKIGKFIVKQ